QEGESGRKQIAKYTRWLTILLAFVQSYGLTLVFAQGSTPGHGLSLLSRLGICISLTAGSMFLLWIGEQVTQKGVGNGVSLVIFAVSLVLLPATVVNYLPGDTGFIGGLKSFVSKMNPAEPGHIIIPMRPEPKVIPVYGALVAYFLLVIVFTYFYTAIVMNVQE